jgi:hypothetical protein
MHELNSIFQLLLIVGLFWLTGRVASDSVKDQVDRKDKTTRRFIKTLLTAVLAIPLAGDAVLASLQST